MALALTHLLLISVVVCGLSAIPVVIKESSPNGESIIAISSSDPEVEKYILDYAARRAKQNPATTVEARSSSNGGVGQSFSIATPDRNIAGTGRSFGDDSLANPFFAPYLTSDLETFDVNKWLKSLEKFYDPNFAGSGSSVTATAINDNGQFYGKVQTVNSNTRGHK